MGVSVCEGDVRNGVQWQQRINNDLQEQRAPFWLRLADKPRQFLAYNPKRSLALWCLVVAVLGNEKQTLHVAWWLGE
jgi:hypothetical protein